MKWFFLGLLLSLNFSFGFDDILFQKQWGLKNSGQIIYKFASELEFEKVKGIPNSDINWVDTSKEKSDENELIVAIIDSGVDVLHPDLVGRLVPGYNFLDDNSDVRDDMGHGTHLAGIIAANLNGIGIVGAADPRIKIMPLKVTNSKIKKFTYNQKLMTDILADAIVFAVKNKAEVLNISMGWPSIIDTPKVRQAFELAEKENVIVVAASGNNSKDLPIFPCAYRHVVCVGAIDNRGELTDFSNHGAKIDLVAPGEYIVSTIPSDIDSYSLRIFNYEAKRGSSMAAPFVSAAVATLKLLNSNLSNDKVRSLLFKSSHPLAKNDQNHFIKYGALDMKKLLSSAKEIDQNSFLDFDFKSLTEIKYNFDDRQFHFEIPVKNLSNDVYNEKVCVDSSTDEIIFDQNCFMVKNLRPNSSVTLNFQGAVKNILLDSHQIFSFKTKNNTSKTSLVFNRDLQADSHLITKNIIGGNFLEMGFINGDRKLSKMARVIDKHRQIPFPEYFYLEKNKQSSKQTVVSLLTLENDQYIVKEITLPPVGRILSIHRQDVNIDGEVDYFIYALAVKEDELLFFNLDKKLKPLFKENSNWSMPLTSFGGLPIDGGVEKFEWLYFQHPILGKLLVPSILSKFSMPEDDNSKNILDRVIGHLSHQYYFMPTLQSGKDTMKVELRVLDSVILMKKLRSELKLFSYQKIELLKTFPQNLEQLNRGEVHVLASVNDGPEKMYLELIFTKNGISFMPYIDNIGLDTAMIYPVINILDGKISEKSIFTSLINRSSAELLIKEGSRIKSTFVFKQEYDNPIMGLIASFSDADGGVSYLVENRTNISLIKPHSKILDLPIYRDSSFINQSFSETFLPILVNQRPAVFVNSSLIFGNRLYSMLDTDEGFIRPIYLSVSIPANCLPLNPEIFLAKNIFSYSFLCDGPNGQISLKFLPMSNH